MKKLYRQNLIQRDEEFIQIESYTKKEINYIDKILYKEMTKLYRQNLIQRKK